MDTGRRVLYAAGADACGQGMARHLTAADGGQPTDEVVPVRMVFVVVLAVVGLALLAAGCLYLAEPAKHLPSFFPAHAARVKAHAVHHGIAALVVGALALVVAVVARPRPRLAYQHL